MSLISLLLSSKEVILSLVVIGLILFSIIVLAVMPVISRHWKKRMARKRAKQAAELARLKKNQINKQRANAAAKKRALEAMMEQIAPAEDDLVSVVDEVAAMPPAQPTPEIIPEPVAVAETESETPSSLQNMLDSVFIDEDANLRLQNLLKGTESVSAQALTELADSILNRFTALDEIREEA